MSLGQTELVTIKMEESEPINKEGLLIPDTKFSICFAYSDIGNEDANTCVSYCMASLKHTYNHTANMYHIKYTAEKQDLISTRTRLYMKMRQDLRGNLIFVDIDIIAYNAIPDDLWNLEFDVGLIPNEKNYPMMPFDGSVMFVKDTPEALDFMKNVAFAASNVSEGLFDSSDRLIDQLAIAHSYHVLKDKVKFGFFRTDLFSFVPKGPQATDAYFVHCKGSQKNVMKQYLCGILGSDYIA